MVLPVEFTIAGIIGVLTIIVSVLTKLIGFPHQASKNYKRKSTKGLSTVFMLLTLVAYVLWTLHGLIQGDWVLVVGQGIGVLTAGIIVLQIIIYRNN